MSRLAVILALMFLVFSPRVALAGHFDVEARLNNGQEVRGVLNMDRFEFDALVPTGETVRINVVSPPGWSSLRTILEIRSIPQGGRLLVRAFNWTGEASLIRMALPLRTSNGATILLEGAELREARFTWSP
jgi:hypothetical protein